ncbi:MAG: YcgL domain-containing protein [Halothiobacillaceae bacterium]|jgi:uncharacterized protein YcgL (UPF0745 family)|nr:YcgL domain-containing protein [Halothiobacillaceae bacterium]
MKTYIYRSLRKADMYVYLAERDAFDRLPEPMRRQIGRTEFVMELTLSAQRPLAREDVQTVLRNLGEIGFHIQMPPSIETLAHWDNAKLGVRGAR